jgi:hypothetical protein
MPSARICVLVKSGTGIPMLDIIFIGLGIAGFAVCLGYVFLCDRL